MRKSQRQRESGRIIDKRKRERDAALGEKKMEEEKNEENVATISNASRETRSGEEKTRKLGERIKIREIGEAENRKISMNEEKFENYMDLKIF